MNKLIAALVAVLVTGAAGFTVAQETPRPDRPQFKFVEVETTDEAIEVVLLEESDLYVQHSPQPEFRFLNMQHGQPGTWQIVTLDNTALLLNTATGESFSLDNGEEGLRWKPIHRPMPEMQRNAEPRKRAMPDMKDVEARLEELRKELRNTKGEAREKLERAIEELERNRERKDAEPERNRERKDVEPERRPERKDAEPERKRDQDNFENQMREIEETIETLRKRFEESDSVKEREKIERTIKDLKEKAENLRKEHKKER